MNDMSENLFSMQAGNALAAGRSLPNMRRVETLQWAKKVAEEFEAVFLGQMLQPMFKNIEAAEPFGGSPSEKMWRTMQVEEYGKAIEIAAAAMIPGTTSAPKLQPIETRVVMLQSGFRAPMGIKVFGPDLETIEAFGLDTLKIIDEEPKRLRSVQGIGRKRAAQIRESWAEHKNIQSIMIFLQGHGVGSGQAVRSHLRAVMKHTIK